MEDSTRAIAPMAGLPRPKQTAEGGLFTRLSSLEPSALARQLTHMALALRRPGAEAYRPLSALTGLPLGEVLASPFALRAVAMAAGCGAAAMHHEIRTVLDWSEDAGGSDAIADHRHGQWISGVLHTGKYQSFCQDDPLTAFNPAYMSKWGPHELFHRVCAFFWRPQLSKWELYLGARLNEQLPVALWYALDEVMRLDRDGFDRSRDAAVPRARLEDARWLVEDEGALEARAQRTVSHLLDGLVHLQREFDAVDEELACGRRRSVTHPVLDASSDATAYVVGHHTRLSSRPFSILASTVLRAGRDYHETVTAYRQHIFDTLDELLFATLVVDPVMARSRRTGRVLWDVLARVARASTADFASIEPLLPRARRDIDASFSGHDVDLDSWCQALSAALPPSVAAVYWASGGGDRLTESGIEQLSDGLQSVVPASAVYLESVYPSDRDLLADFAASAPFWDRGALPNRFHEFSVACGYGDAVSASLIELEAAIAGATDLDELVERLCSPLGERPLSACGGQIAANTAFSIRRLERDVVPLHMALCQPWGDDEALPGDEDATLELPAPGGPREYFVGRYRDLVTLVPAPSGIEGLWTTLCEASLPSDVVIAHLQALTIERSASGTDASPEDCPLTGEAWLGELLAAGVLGWLPPSP